MKHRGRHRRRRRARALRAALAGTALSLTAAATLISASQAQVDDGPGPLRALDSPAARGELRLTEHRVPARWLDRLSSSMGRPVGARTVLGSADRELREAADCTAEERAALPVAPAATRAYCWSEDDTRGWRPGAVTTSEGASADGRWGGHRVILSAWSSEEGGGHDDSGGEDGPGPRRGVGPSPADRPLSRVAFVDADDPDRPRHVSALLVVPVDGGRDYRSLGSPVSGMVWYGDRLLVTAGAGDRATLYAYDMDRVLRTTVGAGAVGRVPGGWSAHGYRYVLPAVAAYRPAGAAPRPAALSLDRTASPAGVVAGERVPAGAGRPARLWRYALGEEGARTGPLAADAAGHVDAVEVYETRAAGIGGVLAHRPSGSDRTGWYLTRAAREPGGRAVLGRQDGAGAEVVECGADRSKHCWSGETGSLSYDGRTGEVWSQSGRALFAVPLASIDAALR
ncbi:hypothetical protein SUDANB58_04664 [Streptomyces sp. enrichment culture]|uniref:hypothetical protein n=1 Tax=Streptomyces sp. enrichment culture TaxID=1795815 RepID=UPI003F577708